MSSSAVLGGKAWDVPHSYSFSGFGFGFGFGSGACSEGGVGTISLSVGDAPVVRFADAPVAARLMFMSLGDALLKFSGS